MTLRRLLETLAFLGCLAVPVAGFCFETYSLGSFVLMIVIVSVIESVLAAIAVRLYRTRRIGRHKPLAAPGGEGLG